MANINEKMALAKYPELCLELKEAMTIAVEFGIDCSEAEKGRFVINHPETVPGYGGAEEPSLEVNTCGSIQYYFKDGGREGHNGVSLVSWVKEELKDWGFCEETEVEQEVDAFLKKHLVCSTCNPRTRFEGASSHLGMFCDKSDCRKDHCNECSEFREKTL
tara:strand:- start:6035 stop:6517 length:483 start_codon:yes stop_codon:yes gene_type:complete